MWGSEYRFRGANNSQMTGLFQILLFVSSSHYPEQGFSVCTLVVCSPPFLPCKWLEFLAGIPATLSFVPVWLLSRKEGWLCLCLVVLVPWVMSILSKVNLCERRSHQLLVRSLLFAHGVSFLPAVLLYDSLLWAPGSELLSMARENTE